MSDIYADHAATTEAAPEVVAAMHAFLTERFGNASSVHRRGEAARAAIDGARERVAALIGAAPEEIVFTASGSEANNLALKGIALGAPAERRRIVISAIEHPSVLETAHHLASRGFPVTVVPVESHGVVDLMRLKEALANDVALLSLMTANNETGVLQPVADAVAMARGVGAKVHTDAIQAVGKIPVDVAALDVDLLSLAGHKFHGPPGAAALYAKRRTRLVPLVHGGHQERSRRAGTENLPAIVGLGAAAVRAAEWVTTGAPRIARLGDRLLEGLLAGVHGAALNGHRERRIKSIVNVRLAGVDGEAVLHELDIAGIAVSTGSACSAATPGPSHVLVAMGLSPEEAHASVRFSLGESNGETDIERILTTLLPILARLRALAGGAERIVERSSA